MATEQHRKCAVCGKNRSYGSFVPFTVGLVCSHCYVTKPCGYDKCWTRRPHHERPDETRPHQQVPVMPGHVGKAFCSMECTMYAGYMSVRGWTKDPRTDEVFPGPVQTLPKLES